MVQPAFWTENRKQPVTGNGVHKPRPNRHPRAGLAGRPEQGRAPRWWRRNDRRNSVVRLSKILGTRHSVTTCLALSRSGGKGMHLHGRGGLAWPGLASSTYLLATR